MEGWLHVNMCLLKVSFYRGPCVKMCILSAVCCVSRDAVQIKLAATAKRSDTIEADLLLNSTFKTFSFLFCLRFLDG